MRKLKPGGEAADENDRAGFQKIPATQSPLRISILRGLNSPQLAA
jgi:hypothetical protein